MKPFDCGRYALACAATAALAACGGSQNPVGAGPGAEAALRAQHSWTLPEARNKDLLYVSDWRSDDVYVYSYPKPKLVGTLTGFSLPAGMCVDKAGDVWITSMEDGNVVEYAHGGVSSIRTLNNGSIGMGCAVDQPSGNLAVTSLEGGVTIWKDAQGPPAHYAPLHLNQQTYFCGYDGNGNLYVDGYRFGYRVGVDELPKGRHTFVEISLPMRINTPGGVQWDGKDVVIGDFLGNIYRFTIARSKAALQGTTQLIGTDEIWQFWIQGSRIVGPSWRDGDVDYWDYPGGGTAVLTITGLQHPGAVVVSIARKDR